MKKVFVTGITSHLGKQLLVGLLHQGYFVYATYQKHTDIDLFMQEIYKTIPQEQQNFQALCLDLSLSEEIHATLSIISDIDVVIQNASMRSAGDINDFSIADYTKMFQVNVFSSIEIYTYFQKIFIEKHSGQFIQIGSIADKKPFLYDSIYAATKQALSTLNIGFYNEAKEHGYHSTLVYFGPLRGSKKLPLIEKEKYSDYFGSLKESDKRNPQEVVDGILALIKNPVDTYCITL